MASEKVRQLARENPEAFENVAGYCDGQLGEHLMQVLREETEPQTQNADQVAASAD